VSASFSGSFSDFWTGKYPRVVFGPKVSEVPGEGRAPPRPGAGQTRPAGARPRRAGCPHRRVRSGARPGPPRPGWPRNPTAERRSRPGPPGTAAPRPRPALGAHRARRAPRLRTDHVQEPPCGRSPTTAANRAGRTRRLQSSARPVPPAARITTRSTTGRPSSGRRRRGRTAVMATDTAGVTPTATARAGHPRLPRRQAIPFPSAVTFTWGQVRRGFWARKVSQSWGVASGPG
jgi:hypothetical protein